MNSTWGKNLRLSVFGESHGEAIGVVIDGFPAGFAPDMEEIGRHMQRRAPGQHLYSTPRSEADLPKIISGVFGGKTTGAPICCLIQNTNTRSADYGEMQSVMRPGHSDYPAYVKYGGCNDVRGGGHFSGRLTAPLVFAGSLCRQYLAQRGMHVFSHIYQVGSVTDAPFDTVAPPDYTALFDKPFCVIDDARGRQMMEQIEQARQNMDSVGGIIEGLITGLPVGVGNPIFHSVESALASILFSIPAVKGVEFGAGFSVAAMRGSECNDPYYYEGETVKTQSNRCGGILGGITNGMPVSFKAAFKPTPTIGQPQQTVDVAKGKNAQLSARGRHDPCILPRAAVVVESAAAVALMDLILGG